MPLMYLKPIMGKGHFLKKRNEKRTLLIPWILEKLSDS